jgi:ABC-2 type transport system ATP-binding protein
VAAVIVVEHLAKRYGDLQAVVDVSFEVQQGEIFGILGPNGAGKTTSVECVQGLRTPDAGRVDVLGLDPTRQASALRQRTGAQLQESSLPPRLRVGEALSLFSAFQVGGPPWRTVMRDWGLDAKEKAAFGSLSGGQRQRLLVALALVNDPQVVFLDEMTTGLDPAARRSTWELVERIRDQGTTVVLVTHFMDEAERLCDRLAVVLGGRVVATGTPAGLVAAHSDGVTVAFSAGGADVSFLETLPGVRRVEVVGDRVLVRGTPAVPPHVGKALVDRGLAPADMDIERASLEDVYLRLVEESGPS